MSGSFHLVSDFRPQAIADRKQKRGFETWLLQLTPTTDILAKLGELKGDRVHVGFALESEDLELNANRKLERKNLDWIVANDVSPVTGTFGGDTNQVYLLTSGDPPVVEHWPVMSKTDVAERLSARIADALVATKGK